MLPRNAYSSDEEYNAALRDWFAGQALAGLLGHGEADFSPLNDASPPNFAESAYRIADAMLAHRELNGQPVRETV